MKSRNSRRFETSLSARLFGQESGESASPLKASIISFGAGGCAIRTALRLEEGGRLTLEIPFELQSASKDTPRRALKVTGEVVWGRPDYRIDTSYLYGVRFLAQLSDTDLAATLSEEALLDELVGPCRSPEHNKVVA